MNDPLRTHRTGAERVSSRPTSDLWWKSAVIYCLDVETFLDYDGDGCGDLEGLGERIDYLAGIGVSCIWLMPFYPSAQRDDGYDITDFYGIDPRLGTHGDLVELVRTARDRGIRVIADLVPNHTSIDHPWFQEARNGPDNPFHDYYVWADEKPRERPGDVVFPDKENSNWAYDRKARRWYLHRFYSHQPDLNVANPQVREELAQIIGFWLTQGLSGFRLDAVPFLIEPTGMPKNAIHDPHELLRDMRSFMRRRKGESILLGEVNLPPDQQREFFGDGGGDELDMLFSFTVNQALYLALAREDARPLVAALDALPQIPSDCQWAHFVRNHDELSLDQLSDEEREEVFAAFGPDPEMQMYGRGLRRRLPSMLGGDERRMRMVYSLMFSLPGTPVLFYGEEIGMAENPAIEGRYAVRAPMQWSAERNAGFTTAARAGRPPLDSGPFGFAEVNVARQRRGHDSLLNWMERLIRRRRECPEIGWGTLTLLEQADTAILAHRCDWRGSTIVAVHNLAARATEARLEVDADGVLVDLFDDAELPPGAVALAPYDRRWFRLRPPGERVAP
jgi:maltose alpha-D-glucosyltransferase/alpha-amylase